MTRAIILIVLFAALTVAAPARATIEFGFSGQSTWSDNDYVGNPTGWGLFFSRSLSPRVSVRLAYNRYSNDFHYIGNFLFGLVPPDADTSREIIAADASTKYVEMILLHSLVDGSRMRLDIGGGLGLAYFDLHLTGQSTGTMSTTNEDGITLTWMVETTVKHLIYSPLALKMGYQYHKSSTMEGLITDAFVPFDEIAHSGVYAALVARW